MMRSMLVLMLGVMTFTGVQPLQGGDRWVEHRAGYAYPIHGPYPPPYPPAQEGTPLLQKLILGGILVGVGFAAGRLTASRPSHHHARHAPPPYSHRHPRHSPRGW